MSVFMLLACNVRSNNSGGGVVCDCSNHPLMCDCSDSPIECNCEPTIPCDCPESPTAYTYNLVVYIAFLGGTIYGNNVQNIRLGYDATQINAIPNVGYRFVRWSDGLTSSFRWDTNIITTLVFTAEFERISFLITYIAGHGGSIGGETQQTVRFGENAGQVTAIPDLGYTFVSWCDGIIMPTRRDINITEALIFTAQFEYTFDLPPCVSEFPQYTFTRISGRNNEVNVRARNRNITLVNIPPEVMIDGNIYLVTEVAISGFASLPNLRRVTLPDTIRRVNNSAFLNNTNLDFIYLPEGLESIGSSAFAMSPNKRYLIIPASVQIIGANILFSNSSYDVAIHARAESQPSGWVSTWNRARQSHPTLPTDHPVIFGSDFDPQCITEYSDLSFMRIAPNEYGVALRDFSVLEINIPSHIRQNRVIYPVTEIMSSGFAFSGIRHITLPSTIRRIGFGAFMGSSNLETVYLSEGLIEIKGFAFAGTNLPFIIIPKSVEVIEAFVFTAFLYNDINSNFIIHARISEVPEGWHEHWDIRYYSHVSIEDTQLTFHSVMWGSRFVLKCITEHVNFRFVRTTPTEYGIAARNLRVEEIDVPSHVKREGVIYPVTVIIEQGFAAMETLRRVSLPATITRIGEGAFMWSINLTEVYLHEGIVYIGGFAFAGTGLSIVTIPKSVKIIEAYVFAFIENPYFLIHTRILEAPNGWHQHWNLLSAKSS